MNAIVARGLNHCDAWRAGDSIVCFSLSRIATNFNSGVGTETIMECRGCLQPERPCVVGRADGTHVPYLAEGYRSTPIVPTSGFAILWGSDCLRDKVREPSPLHAAGRVGRDPIRERRPRARRQPTSTFQSHVHARAHSPGIRGWRAILDRSWTIAAPQTSQSTRDQDPGWLSQRWMFADSTTGRATAGSVSP